MSRVISYVIATFLVAALAACGKSSGTGGGEAARSSGQAPFEVPGEWQPAPGFEASPVGAEEPYLVFQSKDFHDLLVVPPEGDQAWVLDLGDKRVAEIPRGRLVMVGDGAQVSSAQPVEKGVFTKTGADIFFQAGEKNIRVYPWAPLTGEMDLATLLAKKKEYAESAAEYTPDPWAVGVFKEHRKPLEIVAFFGTWCSTCRRYLPDLIRAFQDANNPALTVRYIGVDETLTTPRDKIEQFHVNITPTVIVLDQGHEIGRLAGMPKASIERDVANIVAGHR